MKTALDEPAVGNKCFPLPAAASALSRPFQLGLCFCGLLGALQSVRAQQNTPPIISAIPGQVTAEDVPLIGIPFTVWDAETAPEQLTFSTALDLGGSLSRDSILISGNGTNRALSIFPPPDSFGTGVAFVTVRDAGGLATAIKFNVEVRPVNDPPRLSPIPDQVALKGQGVFRVPFSAFDVETGERLSLQALAYRIEFSISPSASKVRPVRRQSRSRPMTSRTPTALVSSSMSWNRNSAKLVEPMGGFPPCRVSSRLGATSTAMGYWIWWCRQRKS